MRRLHKGRRVSWASDLNLRQVRLFLSEDSPSQVGLGAQDHLQAKTSWLLHSTGSGSDDILPPGFEVAHPENQLQIKLSQIPVNQWKCPPKFVLNLTWRVVVGEESQEIEVENQREMRVLEAVYPRASAIPPNPSIAADSERTDVDDSQTPLIPITPVEDEDASTEISSDYASPGAVLMSAQQSLSVHAGTYTPQHVFPNMSSTSSASSMAGMDLGNEPDVAAAASAALSALVKSNEMGNTIDSELLVKILNNPKMIEQLVVDSGTVTSSQKPISSPDPSLVHMHMTETNATVAPASGGPFFAQPNGATVGPVPNAHPSSRGVPVSSLPSTGPPMKDLNYYKSLIQQHGGERQDDFPRQQFGNRHSQPSGTNQDFLHNNQPSRDGKFRIMKPCIYFNSSRGCRHGANCAYQHDPAFQQRSSSAPEMPSAKRTKVDREISS
ncbi:zinc finger CCCH domain-containing protein 6-like isoform X1 [Cucurbita pepo subsp. pepo]|uniref:zinc finger CCCH domain-containing protein 6-like isoform X1 n=1 Tax=Cucurbita pepo subsp. pepo TaxID=3664 RepID=UPI000C9D7430|nr:zinc finger CCCH domain-containing protein 6-like isoform X1 [Cucurbita pepo subsp. pepo]